MTDQSVEDNGVVDWGNEEAEDTEDTEDTEDGEKSTRCGVLALFPKVKVEVGVVGVKGVVGVRGEGRGEKVTGEVDVGERKGVEDGMCSRELLLRL